MRTLLVSFVSAMALALPLAVAHAEPGQITLPHGDPRQSPVASPSSSTDPKAPVVILNVVVEADGRISNATVARSSGDVKLDWVAVDQARGWHFVPGTVDGVPVRMQNRIAVRVKPREPQQPQQQPPQTPARAPLEFPPVWLI